MDLFKDDDSSSSDENDQILNAGAKANAAGMGGDFMAFDDTANIMPLSNRYTTFNSFFVEP
jgi:hypothetical protein